MASSVAGVIEPALQAAENCSLGWPPDSRSDRLRPLSARLCDVLVVLKGNARGAASDGASDRARSALRARTRLGRFVLFSAGSDRSERRSRGDRLRGIEFARRALEVARDDPGTLVSATEALAWFGEDIGAMMALVDRALALSPNFARGSHISGVLRLYAGQPDTTIEHVETSLRLSPRPSRLVASHDRLRAFPPPAL